MFHFKVHLGMGAGSWGPRLVWCSHSCLGRIKNLLSVGSYMFQHWGNLIKCCLLDTAWLM